MRQGLDEADLVRHRIVRQEVEALLPDGFGLGSFAALTRQTDGDQPWAAAALARGHDDGALDAWDPFHCGLDVGEDHQETVALHAETRTAEDLDVAVGADLRKVAGREPVAVSARLE